MCLHVLTCSMLVTDPVIQCIHCINSVYSNCRCTYSIYQLFRKQYMYIYNSMYDNVIIRIRVCVGVCVGVCVSVCVCDTTDDDYLRDDSILTYMKVHESIMF